MRLPKNWWMGLPVLAGLVYAASNALAPAIEADLARRVGAALEQGGAAIDHPMVEVAGRDARVSGQARSQDGKSRALAAASRVEGLRALSDATNVLGVAKPFVLSFERKGGAVSLRGSVPNSGDREKLAALFKELGLETNDGTAFATGAPSGFFELAQFAARRVAELDPGQATLTDAAIDVAGVARGTVEYDSALAAAKAPPSAARAVAARILPPPASPYVWSAANSGDMIALSGYLPSGDLRSAVVAKAAAVSAGVAVSDAQQVASGAPHGDFPAAVAFALTELGKLSQGKVSIVGAALAIEGQGRENVDAAAIRADASRGLPAGFELARVEVAPGPVSPYVFSAKLREDRLELEGFAPDVSAKRQLLDAAGRMFLAPPGAAGAAPKVAIVDGVRAAFGAPRNFASAAVASLQALSRLNAGEASISGAEVRLSGEARYERAVPDIERRLAEALPPGFKAGARLKARAVGSSLDAEKCRAALNAVLSRRGLSFDAGSDGISQDSAGAFDALAAAVLRCQDHKIEVAAHTDRSGIGEVLRTQTKRRAQAVVDRLVEAGADPSKLTAAGYGNERPLAPNNGDENRARHRRLEFTVQ